MKSTNFNSELQKTHGSVFYQVSGEMSIPECAMQAEKTLL